MKEKELLEGYGCIVSILAFVLAVSVSVAAGIAFGAVRGLLAFSAFTLAAIVFLLFCFAKASGRG